MKIFLVHFTGSTHEGTEPEFDVFLPNLTVKQGSDVSYTCIVKRLGAYRVSFTIKVDGCLIKQGSQFK